MGSEDNPQNWLDKELESLRAQIAELRRMMDSKAVQPEPAHPAPPESPEALQEPAHESVAPDDLHDRIQAEIRAHMGFVPPFFESVEDEPEIYAFLWHHMRASYLRNPIPPIAKEKLFARLSRYCPVPYALLAHSCALRHLGLRTGEILNWLEQPVPRAEELDALFAQWGSSPRPLTDWPEPGSTIEEAVLRCALVLFLGSGGAVRCREELIQLLGHERYGRLIMFLAYVRMHFSWLQAYPNPDQDKDEIIRTHLAAMAGEELRLTGFLANYFETPAAQPPAHVETGKGVSEGALIPDVLEYGPVGIIVLNPDYGILNANKAFLQMLAYGENELPTFNFPALIHPRDVGNSIHMLDQILSGAQPRIRVEQRFLKSSKEFFWGELTASAIRDEQDAVRGCIGFIEDIDERKKAEEKRLQEEQLYERVVLENQDGIFTFNRDLACTSWNPAMERIFGIQEADALGNVILDVLPFLAETGEDKHILETLRGDAVSVRNRPFHIESTGREGFYDAHYSALLDKGGKVSGGITFIRDTTERRNAEESRRATENRYLELFENANDIVYTHDLDGRITSLNKVAERITGYERAEALGLNASQLLAPEHLPIVCKMIERQVAGESPVPYEIEIICKDGRRVALEVNAHIIAREGKPIGVQGIARDITERKKTEEALQHAKQNLESWVHELEQRTREMTLLSEMGDMLRACLTTEEAYSVIVRVAQQIFPVQVGALYVIAPGRDVVEAVAVWGDSSEVERAFAPDECWALRRGRVHWVEDSKVGLLCKHLHQPPPEGYICVPMMAQSEALGILHLTQPGAARLTEAKQRLALTMAEHIAMALSNLKLHETLRSQSIRDPLTGLFNRRFMEESLELELRRAARNRRPLGLIMLEIDNLQEVTRAYGTEAENGVLLEIGNLLQTIIRKEDIACRFGTEKFAVVLPQGSMEITAQRAENLREMIRELEIRHRGRPIGHVTVSGGIAGFPEQGRTGESLLRAAEAALQRARQEGGDRISAAQ